jgi:AraC-like DNA-binding protein
MATRPENTAPQPAAQVRHPSSSFHKIFKTITSTTPLQYQKELRLLEARRLLKTCGSSVTTAAYEVGYESPEPVQPRVHAQVRGPTEPRYGKRNWLEVIARRGGA